MAKEENYPGLNRVTEGLYPPGSTFKPVTALAAMQERLISPYQTLQCTPRFEVHGQVFKNWDPYADEPMTLPQALGASCDTYFYNLGYSFYALPPDRGHPLQGWASRFGFGAPTGVDVGPEQSGLLPTPEWRQATYTKKSDPCCWQIDRLWKPGDSIQLAIGQKDLLVTPLQMVRFYSLIANGGKLVEPHLVQAVGKPGGGGMVPLNPRRREDSKVDPNALAVVRDGLYRATHASYGTATAVFGNFPITVAGKTGTAEKVVQPPGYAQPCSRTSPGGAATRRPRRQARRLRRDRERRPRRHRRGADRPQGVRALLPHDRASDRRHPLRLMAVTYTPTERSRARARRRSLTQDAPLLARLDWVMLAAVLVLVAYGLWSIAGITRHDVAGSPDYFVYRQIVFVVVGGLGLVAAILIDPDLYRRYQKHLYLGTLLLLAIVFLAGTVARGSKRWIDLGFFRFQPSEFGKLLVVLALAGYLADRYRRVGELRVVATTIALSIPPMLLVFIQPDFGSALVYAAALFAVLFVAGIRWLHLAILALAATALALAVLWWLPAAGMPVLKAYQKDRLTGFLNPSHDPSGSTYNITQSQVAVGSGGAGGRGVEGATQTSLKFLPEHATDFAFASLAEQRGFLGAGFLLMLYLLVVWRGLKVVCRRPETPSPRSRRAGSCSPSCSRSS